MKDYQREPVEFNGRKFTVCFVAGAVHLVYELKTKKYGRATVETSRQKVVFHTDHHKMPERGTIRYVIDQATRQMAKA